jgi:hypothetical protein
VFSIIALATHAAGEDTTGDGATDS